MSHRPPYVRLPVMVASAWLGAGRDFRKYRGGRTSTEVALRCADNRL